MQLSSALQYPDTKTVQRLARRHGSFKRALLILDAQKPTYTGISYENMYGDRDRPPKEKFFHLPLCRCFYKHIWLVRLFLTRGFNPATMLGRQNRTLLHYAAINGERNLVQLLIASTKTIERKTFVHHTPIIWAVFGDNLNIVKDLLSAGADVHGGCEPNFMSGPFVPIAKVEKDSEMFKLLLDSGGIYYPKD